MPSRDILMAAAGVGGASGSSDPYFYDVSLLLTGDGTNGAQNNTFLDSSTNNFTITRNGNTTQGTFSPYGSLWSNYFDGSGDYLNTTSSNVGLSFGTGNFTVECWVNWSRFDNATSSEPGVFQTSTTSGGLATSYTTGVMLVVSGGVYIVGCATNSTFATTYAPKIGEWHHVAIVRNSGTVTCYVNGVSVGSQSNSNNVTANYCAIGGYYSTSYLMNGYVSNLRFVKGTAVYTSNFTPPTSPLTAISGTSLLTCQSNRFIDNSSNNSTFTRHGDTKVTRFSPFNPVAPYSAATIGGSVYFDGTGDYLTLNGGTGISIVGDFTYEVWIYPTTVSPTYQQIVYGPSLTGASYLFQLLLNGSTLYVWNALSHQTAVTPNAWHHVALVRQSNTTYLYLDGVRSNSSATFTQTATIDTIGGTSSGIELFNGYQSNARFVSSALYTSSFTPPTSPVTAISGTSLLCNFTNAGIPDAAMMNDLETVGNAQVSTSVKKYGTGSLYFPATASYLKGSPFSNNLNTTFNGDFTVEFWYYPTNAGAAKGAVGQGLFDTRNGSTASSPTGFVIYNNSSGNKISVFTNGSNLITSTTSPSNNTWYHIALTRYSGTMRLFINGTQEGGNASYSTAFTDGYCLISGVTDNQSGTYMMFEGYIDDLRVTKGYARYTTNFTPPTAAFPTY